MHDAVAWVWISNIYNFNADKVYLNPYLEKKTSSLLVYDLHGTIY